MIAAAPPLSRPPDAARAALQRLLMGQLAAQAVYAAAKLGLADLLADGPSPLARLAAAVEADRDALGRLLRALADLGLVEEPAPGTFALTEAGAWLRDEIPNSARPAALFYGEEYRWALDGLVDSVRTGEPTFARAAGLPFFPYLAANPAIGARFDRNMAGRHAARNAALVAAYDFSPLATLVDLGGGNGALLRAILAETASLRGILFDHPTITARVAAEPLPPDLTGRLTAVPGDFFDAVPAGVDGYLLATVLHDWDDERAARILRVVRRAIPPHGRLLVLDEVVPTGAEAAAARLLDLLMLVLTGGKERTLAEFDALFAAAGFERRRIIPLVGATTLIEASPLP